MTKYFQKEEKNKYVNAGIKILFGAVEMFDRKIFNQKLKMMTEKRKI